MNEGFARPFQQISDRIFAALIDADSGFAEAYRGLFGRRLKIYLEDFELSVFVEPQNPSPKISLTSDFEPDVTIRGTVADFVAAMAAERRGEALEAGRLDLSGDLATATAVQELISRVSIDLEALVAPVIGDVATHQLGRFVRALSAWGTDSARRFEIDLVNYLQREKQLLPKRWEIDQLAVRTRELAAAVDRLDAAIAAERRSS
ncbi:MAG: SCP2 sterol-binding domain-containing protein [Pseudomonadota bacterium]